jgi:hypothetical protein
MKRQRKLTGLLLVVLTAVLALSGSVFAAAKKEGLVKVKSKTQTASPLYDNGKTYKAAYDYTFYENGKMVKKAWKTVKTAKETSKYYFGKNGKAIRADFSEYSFDKSLHYVKTKIGGKYYAFGVDGKMLTGTLVNSDGKIEVYTAKGVYNAKKTKTLRANAKKLVGKVKTLAQIRKVFGKELVKETKKGRSCNDAKWDVNKYKIRDVEMHYKYFTVVLLYNTKTKQYYVDNVISGA